MNDQPSEPIDENKDSSVFGVSIRAWLAVVIVGTVCVISAGNAASLIFRKEEVTIAEPLYSMAVLALGFYFGQKTNKTNQ